QERWGELGEVKSPASPAHSPAVEETGLIVDALFGTGLTRPLSQTCLELMAQFQTIQYEGWRKVAVDIPTGICADSGRVLVSDGAKTEAWQSDADFAFEADLTVTFGWCKLGHELGNGPGNSGYLWRKDIGLGTLRAHQPARNALHKLYDLPTTGPRWWMPVWGHVARPVSIGPEFLDKTAGNHKYTHGHALILSGASGKGGAARLAARAALRIGAGLVTVGCPSDATVENAAQLNAIMLRPIDGPEDLAEALSDDRLSALALGPGLGLDARAKGLVATALGISHESAAPARAGGSGAARSATGRSIVLDADALTLIAANPDLMAALHENCVITPHAGEFARLFPDITEKLNAPATKGPAYSKVDAAREAAARAGCIVLFKGPDTVIATPDGRCSINSAHYDRAAPWLATAGSGDVLTGFIAGLLARGLGPLQAAETAAWLHVECALTFGPGLIAEDLPEQLPTVFRDLGL
ncbi:MAG: NAD(P)H-hydrate dehydratase, partial [Paracoccaceae bacterium]|nr:NAD(P)H-hydrate dehydratase [Paracoccaceae bacterium]